MMFENGLAFAVKDASKKILREVGNKVYVPFGSEYSLVIKNKRHERALVHISIDGQPIDNGGGFILAGKETATFERFVKNLDRGNKFKFIERTKKIEDGPRGAKIDDGLITIDFQFEKKAPKVEEQHVYRKTIIHDEYERHPWYPYHWYRGISHSGGCWGGKGGDGILRSSSGGGGPGGSGMGGSADHSFMSNSIGASGGEPVQVFNCSADLNSLSNFPGTSVTKTFGDYKTEPANEVGITVPGSISDQKFAVGYIWNLEESKYSMTIHLLGVSEKGAPVQQAFTVKSKKVCTTCGTENHFTSKFCKECSTALDIV